MFDLYGYVAGLLVKCVPVRTLVQAIQPQKPRRFGKRAAWKNFYKLPEIIFCRNVVVQMVVAQPQVVLQRIVLDCTPVHHLQLLQQRLCS